MSEYIDKDIVVSSLSALRDKILSNGEGLTHDGIVKAATVDGILSVMREFPSEKRKSCDDCIYRKEVQSKRHFDDDEAN